MFRVMLAGMRILGGILVVLWGSGVAAEFATADSTPGTRTKETLLAIPDGTAAAPLRPVIRGSPYALNPPPRFQTGARARAPMRPRARDPYRPAAQWDDEPRGALWTRSMMSALEGHGAEVLATVPSDIGDWCPAYARNGREERAAFWVGLMSAIAHYESRHVPSAVGAGSFFGLLQIYPPTARGVDCRAGTGDALKRATANLSCAVRIMAEVVPQHDAVAVNSGGWRGIANQWGPVTRASIRSELRDWVSRQDYCAVEPAASPPRPQARPAGAVRSGTPADGSPEPG